MRLSIFFRSLSFSVFTLALCAVAFSPGTLLAQGEVEDADMASSVQAREEFKQRVAEIESKKKNEPKLPKSGVLSATGVMQGGSGAVDTWVDTNPMEAKSVAPISGSVSKSGNDWTVRVSNNSEDGYSFDVKVVQLSSDAKKVKTDYFSFNLKPGESSERKAAGAGQATGAQLVLDNYKKHKTTKKPKSSSSAARR